MSLLETIHELNPLWVLIPAGLFFFLWLLEEHATPKKSDQELEQEQAIKDKQQQERTKLWHQAVNRMNN